MKKKNGFTLIELLAVIVILAVIALIAVPRIIEILNKSRLSAAEDSAMGIVEAAETYVADFMLKNQGAIPSENLIFKCNSEGCNLTNELKDYNTENLEKLEFKGKKPTSGTITVSENGNKISVYGLLINNFVCNYGDGIANCIDSSDIGATQEEPPSTQHEGVKAIVYLDPTDLTNKCNKNNINSDTGITKGCMKWYAYAEDDTQNTYTMLLDHNISQPVAWNSKNDINDPSEINEKIVSYTKDWKGGLNPRLITTEEVLKIINYSSNTFFGNDLYFQNLKDSGQVCKDTGCDYAWLYDRTSFGCSSCCGCLNNPSDYNLGWGYWTSTTFMGDLCPLVNTVHYDGLLHTEQPAGADLYSIRPVITISKSLINS